MNSVKKERKRNGQAGLVRTSPYFKKCQGRATVYDLSCSERVGEIHGVCSQVVIPTDKMNVAEFINKRKKTALLGGCVTHMQTYAHIIQIFTVENLAVAAICSCVQA